MPPIPPKKTDKSETKVSSVSRNINEKQPIGKDFKLDDVFKKRIEQAAEMLDVPLDPNDVTLTEQLTLGDKWDDPFTLTKAMDRQPLYYARWATLLRKLKKEKQRQQQKLDVWMSITKDELQEEIFAENVKAGMTANNAKPTNQSVENRFNKYCSDSKTTYYNQMIEYNTPVQEIYDQIDIVDVIVKAFEQRKDMLISLGSLVRSMVDNQLMIYKQRTKSTKTN